ncbi:cellulose synthase/poly-beta-1,6-N-acetylglucosamine synthase-like glycosyltransferase [Bacillus sp. RC250]
MEAIFNILTVLVFLIIFITLFALITLPFIAKKKNWKKLNISLARGVLKIKIEE